MREFVTKIIQWEGGPEITLYSIYHLLYAFLILGGGIAIPILMRKKSERAQTIYQNVLAILVTAIYIADFFIMPLYRADSDPTTQLIHIDKLPFHFCTFMALVVPFAQFNTRLKNCQWFQEISVVMAIVPALMYIVYPGSALGGIGAFCYKVVQTFMYHGVLLSWGVFRLISRTTTISFKNIWKPALGIVAIMIWASLGNELYYNEVYGNDFNWCFIKYPFMSFIPAWSMPFVVFVCVFGTTACVYLIDYIVKLIIKKKNSKNVESVQETNSKSN